MNLDKIRKEYLPKEPLPMMRFGSRFVYVDTTACFAPAPFAAACEAFSFSSWRPRELDDFICTFSLSMPIYPLAVLTGLFAPR